MSETREHAHELIERLPDAQVSALIKLLEAMIDPVETALRNAPFDDEEESEYERIAVAEAREWLRANGGKGIPDAEAMLQLGLD